MFKEHRARNKESSLHIVAQKGRNNKMMNYDNWLTREPKQVTHINDCQGRAIYPEEAYYVIDGKIYSQDSIDEVKHWYDEY